jgi:hypothetical protein
MGNVLHCTPRQVLEYFSTKDGHSNSDSSIMSTDAIFWPYSQLFANLHNDRNVNIIVFIYEDNKTDKRQPFIMARWDTKQMLFTDMITFICALKEAQCIQSVA